MYFFREQLRDSRLYPSLVLEGFFAHRFRHLIIKTLNIILLIIVGSIIFFSLVPSFASLNEYVPLVKELMPRLVGLLSVLVAFWLLVFIFEVFFRHYYLSGTVNEKKDLVDFTLGRLLYSTKHHDPVMIFADSRLGKRILARAGFDISFLPDLAKVRESNKTSITGTVLRVGQYLTFDQWLETVITDKIFSQFLLEHGVRVEDLKGASRWVEDEASLKRESERWWSLERLSEVPGLAKDWSYGGSYLLSHYARDLNREVVSAVRQAVSTVRDEEVHTLETVLGRTSEANAILIGQTNEDRLSVLLDFASKIKAGRVVPALEHKHLFLFDPEAILSTKAGKELESELIKILNEAVRAGNVILAIDNFASFVAGAKKENVNIVTLFDPYLSSSKLQVIALCTPAEFHKNIETDQALLNRFEKVEVNSPDRTHLNQIAMLTASRLEHRSYVFFTYPGLMELSAASEQYFANEPALDKTIDLLVEIVSWAGANNIQGITRDVALKFISQKTKIPLGEATSDERERLLNVENILHERVVGQNLAIDALGKALRRARTGLRDPKRPIGSFIFLGPTGVGKTETAKALGNFFFKDDSSILRLDMSEYQGADALAKLTGSFNDKKPGILATMLRERPYGVLLLDEFEKTTSEVLNLFLQILDEGFFSDMNGERVNARNLLIVATSNAGSEMIWQLVKTGSPLNNAEIELVNHLVEKQIFKPELLNRFDGIIIFHPLVDGDLVKVAKLQLERLVKRLKDQGVTLKIDDKLIAKVAASGANQNFGARPMARFIQDHLEEAISKKLLTKEIASGSTIVFDDQLGVSSVK